MQNGKMVYAGWGPMADLRLILFKVCSYRNCGTGLIKWPLTHFNRKPGNSIGFKEMCKYCENIEADQHKEFACSPLEYHAMLDRPCVYCGDYAYFAKSVDRFYSVDRKGKRAKYEKYNMVPTCISCNLVKLADSPLEFIKKIQKVNPKYVFPIPLRKAKNQDILYEVNWDAPIGCKLGLN